MRNAIDRTEEYLGVTVEEKFKEFLAAFYTEATAGMLLDWAKNRLSQDRETVLRNILLTYKVSLSAVLEAKALNQSTEEQK